MSRVGVFFILFVLFASLLQAERSVVVRAVVNQAEYPSLSFEELKKEALKKAKEEAAKKIYGEFIMANTALESGRIIQEKVQSVCGGVIHLEGEPRYLNGQNFGEIAVEIHAYATDDEIRNYHENMQKLQTTQSIAKKELKKEKGFYGQWSGYIMNSRLGSTKAVVTITPTGQSKIAFTTLNCGGDLLVKQKDLRYVKFRLYLNYGMGRCRDKEKVVLVKVNDDKIEYTQYSDDDKRVAHGMLYREE